jgi:hypothetical protein
VDRGTGASAQALNQPFTCRLPLLEFHAGP